MPGTYSQILLHVVFSTKERRPWITPEVGERLYAYFGGIVRAENGTALAVGGADDHVHMYLRWRTDETVATLMRVVKSRSTLWVRAEFDRLHGFAWQSGYSVFSVSKSREDDVERYIAGQREHHRRETFRDELRRILLAHGVGFDERYLD